MAVGVGDLGQGLIEDGDVVGGGVRAGVAWPQHAGQGLAGVVQAVFRKRQQAVPLRLGI